MAEYRWTQILLIFFAVMGVALPGWLVAESLPGPFRIIPQPRQVVMIDGAGLGFGELKAVRLAEGSPRPVMGPLLNRLAQADHDGAGVLSLRIALDGSVPDSPEGYLLVISGKKAQLSARGEAGLFYGCQTLEQLLEDARDTGAAIPACRITDYPSLTYRAVQIDVKHHLDHLNYYYESIDRLARYKINAIIFEFEDKLRYRRQPLVGAPQAISIAQMAALTSYASDRHIEISPLVQGLGHATFILKHQQYAHLREQPDNRWAFCPLHEGTYQVLFDLYRDAIDATPGARYLHVGGDEIGNIGLCPRCKPTADKEGVFGLNLYWLNRVCEFAEEHGRIPIFWDDMPLKYAGVHASVSANSTMDQKQAAEVWKKGRPILDGLVGQYPKNCVYMRWTYCMARQPGNIMALDWYRQSGLKTMIATATQSGPAALLPFDDSGEKLSDKGIVAIRSFIQLAAEKKIDGMLCTAWDDRSLHFETYWRGLIASAQYSWSPDKLSLDEFQRAYFQREFGPATVGYAHLYKQLREGVAFWTAAFNPQGNRLDYENALLELPGIAHWIPATDGKHPKQQISYQDRLIDLPDPASPGAWSRKYKSRLLAAAKEARRYETTSEQIKELSGKLIRNRYHWEVLSAINDFQITAAHLLLALRECDNSDRAGRKAGMQLVRAALDEFELAWNNMQRVYAKTRFITYPDNYVKDRYFHFASQREDLSFLVQAEDLYHGMVRQWLEDNQL